MRYCLHPKNPHENREPIISSSGSSNMAPSGASTRLMPVAVGEHVTCQVCKYLLQGALLGDCRVIRWIGSGTFGDVYEAEQLPPLNRRVAIKVMHECVAEGTSTDLFAREVSTIAVLDHPNILPVLRVGMIEDGRCYLVMKYAAQGSLQQFCQPVQPAISVLPTSTPATPGAPPPLSAFETVSIAEARSE